HKKKKLLILSDDPVVIVGVVGVLSKLYWQGQIAYIGGGFSTGIHNVMEPAIARLPVIFGPRYHHAHEAEELLNNGGGFTINNGDEFRLILEKLIENNDYFLNSSFAATNVIHQNLGSSTRIIRSLIRD
ncbi:MAG: 3-deoxy-D-manno-octulosonic acid transferase, partial [Candidatus Marinimicrobia bacterium]|nr:3-deoxy-D-manno-octulosonic acid transferase [Candidatus Neomarinimicrobiota bacterium]